MAAQVDQDELMSSVMSKVSENAERQAAVIVEAQRQEQTDKRSFMDSLLESTLTGKAMMDTRGSRKMDSYEQAKREEDAVWSELAGKGEVDKIFKSADDEDGEPQQQ